MAILCDKNTKLLVQGMGRMGSFHAKLSLEYGTQVVGGVAQIGCCTALTGEFVIGPTDRACTVAEVCSVAGSS